MDFIYRLLWLPALICCFIIGCTDLSEYDYDRVQDAISDSLLSVTESRHIEMSLIEDDHKQVTVYAPRAITFTSNGQTETRLSDSVLVLVKDTLGNIDTRVTSLSARYIGNRSEFHFQDQVVVNTSEGRSLYTDYLKWSHQTRNVETPEFVIIVTANDSITGYGLHGRDDLVAYTLSEVTGEFQMDENSND